jgi:two-component system sensor histidine kinase DegS
MSNRKDGGHQEAPSRLQATWQELQQHVSIFKENEQSLAALNAISDLINQPLEIRQVLTLVADKTMEVMGVDAILIFLVDEETQELVLEVSRGVSERFVVGVRKMKVGEGFNGTVAQTGKALFVDDASTNPLLSRQVVVSEGIRSQLIVPLRSRGKVVGTICVARRRPGQFQMTEVALLSSIGNALGAGLENAILYQEMEQALTLLRQSEERYRDLFENAYDAIWLHDLDGNMLAANKACEKLTGYTADELLKVHICRLIPECSRSSIEQTERKLILNQYVEHRCEGELIKKGGAKALVQITTSLIAHDGEIVGFQHCARDITEERQLQHNLRYYLQQVTRAQEEERKRIARELHDETLQNLIAISRQLEKITSSDALWEESVEAVRSFKKQIEVAVQEIRRFSHDLRPSVLDDLGLLPALELLADDLNKQRITTSFKVTGEARRLAPEVEVMLFRIAQEAVSNIWRHSHASAAELVIEFNNGMVKLNIKDDGSGFRLPQRVGDLAGLGKLGLAGMHERARLLGGTLTLTSDENKGTMVTVEVPVSAFKESCQFWE